MASLNKFMAMGNLTRDPESRTAGSNQVVGFSLAINRKYKDRNGQQGEEVLFIECESWGQPGAIIMQYCKKGSKLYIEGRLKMEQWTDKNSGEKRSRIKVSVDQFQFLSDNRSSENRSAVGDPQGIPDDVPF